MVRESTRRVLEGLGYAVTTASDGVMGLETFREDPSAFDLVLLDMVMPRMNGRDCLRGIRAIAPDTPVVMASGFTGESGVDALRAEGISAFVAKPYEHGELSRVVAEAIVKGRDGTNDS